MLTITKNCPGEVGDNENLRTEFVKADDEDMARTHRIEVGEQIAHVSEITEPSEHAMGQTNMHILPLVTVIE